MVEIPVAGQRQRARNRRRGHVQDVRPLVPRCLGVERRALSDAEPVLLVDDGDPEPRELHRVLDQRVRPDDQLKLTGPELPEQVCAPAARRRSGQQPDGDQRPRHQPLNRREVLLGERLGRCHQRALVAVLDGAQQRVQRDDGLARTQPRPSAGVASGTDCARSPSTSDSARVWSAVKRERQHLARATARSARARPSSTRAVLAARRPQTPAQQRQLHEQQLVERQAAARELEPGVRAAAEMGLESALRPGREAAP